MENALDKIATKEYKVEDVWIRDIKKTADILMMSKVLSCRLKKLEQDYQKEIVEGNEIFFEFDDQNKKIGKYISGLNEIINCGLITDPRDYEVGSGINVQQLSEAFEKVNAKLDSCCQELTTKNEDGIKVGNRKEKWLVFHESTDRFGSVEDPLVDKLFPDLFTFVQKYLKEYEKIEDYGDLECLERFSLFNDASLLWGEKYGQETLQLLCRTYLKKIVDEKISTELSKQFVSEKIEIINKAKKVPEQFDWLFPKFVNLMKKRESVKHKIDEDWGADDGEVIPLNFSDKEYFEQLTKKYAGMDSSRLQYIERNFSIDKHLQAEYGGPVNGGKLVDFFDYLRSIVQKIETGDVAVFNSPSSSKSLSGGVFYKRQNMSEEEENICNLAAMHNINVLDYPRVSVPNLEFVSEVLDCFNIIYDRIADKISTEDGLKQIRENWLEKELIDNIEIKGHSEFFNINKEVAQGLVKSELSIDDNFRHLTVVKKELEQLRQRQYQKIDQITALQWKKSYLNYLTNSCSILKIVAKKDLIEKQRMEAEKFLPELEKIEQLAESDLNKLVKVENKGSFYFVDSFREIEESKRRFDELFGQVEEIRKGIEEAKSWPFYKKIFERTQIRQLRDQENILLAQLGVEKIGIENVMYLDQLIREKYVDLVEIIETAGGEKYLLKEYALGELLNVMRIDLKAKLRADLTENEKKRYFEFKYLSE